MGVVAQDQRGGYYYGIRLASKSCVERGKTFPQAYREHLAFLSIRYLVPGGSKFFVDADTSGRGICMIPTSASSTLARLA